MRGRRPGGHRRRPLTAHTFRAGTNGVADVSVGGVSRSGATGGGMAAWAADAWCGANSLGSRGSNGSGPAEGVISCASE